MISESVLLCVLCCQRGAGLAFKYAGPACAILVKKWGYDTIG